MDDLYEFHLVELVDPDNAPCVPSRASRLPSPAGSVPGHPDGQISLLEQGLAVEIGNRNFRGRNQKEFVVLRGVDFLREFGQLTGSDSAFVLYHVGHADFLVAVLAGLDVEEILYEGTLQAGTYAAENRESAP